MRRDLHGTLSLGQFAPPRPLSRFRDECGAFLQADTNYLFLTSFFLIVTTMIIKFPSLVLSGEFYAETATLFFRMAREASFGQIVAYVGADYLVAFQLFVSFFIVRVLGIVDLFPSAVNLVFIIFVALSASLINMRSFRVLLQSDLLRFVAGLSVAFTPNYDVYQVLNASIFGFTIFFLFIFVEKEEIKPSFFVLLVTLMFLVGIARPNLVALLPIHLVLFARSIKARKVWDGVFFGIGSASLLLQSVVMVLAQLLWTWRKEGYYSEIRGLASFFSPLPPAIYHYIRTLLQVLINREINGFGLIIALTIVASGLSCLACFFLYRQKRFRPLYFFGVSQIAVLGLIYLMTFSTPMVSNWDRISPSVHRVWSYSNFIMYLSFVVLLYNLFKDLVPRLIIGVLILFSINFSLYEFYSYSDPYDGHESLSHWALYRQLMHDDDYYIPVNPVMQFQWSIDKGNGKLPIDIQVREPANSLRVHADEETRLKSLLIVNHDLSRSMKDLIVKAYDRDGKERAIARRMNDFDDKYIYYYFTTRIQPYTLKFFNENVEPVSINPDVLLFGRQGNLESIVVTDDCCDGR